MFNTFAKRCKKNLKTKSNSITTNYVQHKLTEWKADYICSNYSIVIQWNPGIGASGIVELLESGNPGMRENIFSIQMNLWNRGNSDNRGIGACPSCFPHAPIPEVALYFKIGVQHLAGSLMLFTYYSSRRSH